MTQTRNPASTPLEFSRPIEVARLKGTFGQDFDISPNAGEAAKLAALFKANKLSKVRFSGTIKPFNTSEWELTGNLGATIVQPCVITLAPVTTRIDTKVHRIFVCEIATPDAVDIDVTDDVDQELLGPTIDLGALASEELALAVPEYPRVQGAELPPTLDDLADSNAQIRPFDVLKALRDRLSDD